MKTRNTLLTTLFAVLTLLPAHARRPPRVVDYTLLMVPARHGAIQIGRDLEEQEELLLMSYDPNAPEDTPFLHVWRRDSWHHVPASRFQTGDFLQHFPLRVVIVGPDSPKINQLVEQSAHWSRREVLNIPHEDPAELINAMGRILQFRPADWRWYAARYGLELEDLNRGVRHASWYDTYRASDLPPATNPFRRRRDDTEPEPGLRPIIRVEPVPETADRDMRDALPETVPAPDEMEADSTPAPEDDSEEPEEVPYRGVDEDDEGHSFEFQ